MSTHCCEAPSPRPDARYRKVLWIALAVNAAMFLVEIATSAASGSAALAADAADFAGDAANYALSLAAIAAGGLWSTRAALAKGLALGTYGTAVLAYAGWRIALGTPPAAMTMGVVGTLALTANLAVAWLLYAYRNGDANMRSVWLCTRNDVLGNLAVLAAAAGVFGTGTLWPDVVVATLMAGLATHSAAQIVAGGRAELRLPRHVPEDSR
jgi:Co/Zn/Cd efflux system component